MLRLHCTLTDCLGEELPKGCCLASLYDWKIVNVDKITKIVCVDMVTFVNNLLHARLHAPNSTEPGLMTPCILLVHVFPELGNRIPEKKARPLKRYFEDVHCLMSTWGG